MSINNYAAIAASTVFITACATNNIHNNAEFTEAGLTYVEEFDKLIGETLTLVYQVDANELPENRPAKRENKKARLTKKTEATLNLADELIQTRKTNNQLGRYFKALQALINNPSRASMSDSLGNIVSDIAKENHRQKNKYETYASSYENESYLRKLSSMAVNAHYAKSIKDILRRDKDTISQYITLQQQQLDFVAGTYKRHMETAQHLYFKTKLQTPYLNDKLLIGWVARRLEWFEMRQTEPDIEKLMDDYSNLKKAWTRLFQERSDAASINHALSDASQLVDSVSKLNSETDTVPTTLIDLSTIDTP